uniref:Phosphodiesterase n=1 Tax=Meloidogyne enterolobii TaxID=390850 RepID=A0A6V7WCY2_MELEN|nr:unnamed protein product [Meloidogyne enterolobii]
MRSRLQPSVSGGFPQQSMLQVRRESFLYRGGGGDDTTTTTTNNSSPFYGNRFGGGGRTTDDTTSLARPASRASSVTSSEQHNDSFDIVTPFAQLLSSLHNVRANLIAIAQIPQPEGQQQQSQPQQRHSGRRSGGQTSLLVWPPGGSPLPETVQQCGQETLEELDWCLEQLETIQVYRSVTEMASSKFRKLLNRELTHFAESSKSGPQISRFLLNTYMEQEEAQEEGQKMEQKPSTSSIPSKPLPPMVAVAGHASLFNKAKTAAMSRISGVQRLRSSQFGPHHGCPPEFGVPCKKEIEVYMQRINDWGVNIFKMHELSKQHSLTSVTYTLLRERKMLFKFEIPASTLVNYLLHLEHHYRSNPYHNQIHGADVAQSISVLISSPALEGVFSDLEVLAAIFASAIHDVDHPGFTNQYLINTQSELAIMYNDESVLEQHHLAVAFKLLQDRDCDFLQGLTRKQRQSFRKMVIEMVLATDMSKHMSLLADLKTMVEAKKVSGTDTLLDKYQDRIQVLRSAIHLADLSNPAKPIDIYRQWNERILEEYWRQGDREKQLGLEVSPMCDRGNVTVEKSQVGFIDYIVHPLFETWAELVHPDANSILDQLEENRQWYLARMEEEEEEGENGGGEGGEEKIILKEKPPLPQQQQPFFLSKERAAMRQTQPPESCFSSISRSSSKISNPPRPRAATTTAVILPETADINISDQRH